MATMSLSSGLVRFAFPMLTLQPRDLHFADAFRIALQPGLASHRSSWPRRCFASQAVTATKAPTGEACIANGDPPQTQDIKRLQSFDYTAMLACISELQRLWVPARVEEAVQIRESMLALRLRTLNDSGWLYLSWHPAMAHIGLSLAKPQRGDVAEAFSFGEQAHNILKGLVLTQAVVPQLWERTAQLSFATRPGEEPAVTLHIEVMGRYSNAILSKAGGSVLAAGHQVGSKMSSARVVQVGRPYALPPAPPGIPPDACTSFADWQSSVLAAASTGNGASPATVSSCCIKGFLGVGPTLMRTLCVAAGIDPGAEAGSLSPADWEHLHAEWRAWLQYIGSGEFDAAPACTKYLTFGSRQRRQGQAMLEYVRDYYANFESEEEFGRAKQRVEKGVSAGLTRLSRKIESLRRQSSDGDAHLTTSKLGDLLMAHLHLVQSGAASVTVEDWDTEEQVTIPLDTTKTPVACAEALYAKARKQRRAVVQVAPLIAEAQEQMEYLNEVHVMLGQLSPSDPEDVDALKQTERELVSGGFLKAQQGAVLADKAAAKARRAAKKGKGRSGGATSGDSDGFRQYISPNGFTVLLGRNSGQNDVLSTKMAQPRDVWMHARGVPGAHLLLRVPAGQTAADEDVQFAADLAAYFSKSRTEGKAEVTVANPADISKPRGAKPGQVLVKKETVLLGRPAKSAAAAAGDD